MIVLSGLLKGCRCLLEVNPLIAKSLDNFTSKIVLFGQQHSGRNNAPPPPPSNSTRTKSDLQGARSILLGTSQNIWAGYSPREHHLVDIKVKVAME